jgi:hypothetical protein
MSELSPAAQAIKPFKDDFLFYAPRALHIRTKDGNIKPFLLNSAQLYIHHRLEDQLARTGKIRALIIKGRQQGVSTYVEGRFYWRTSLAFGKQALILTHLQDSTDALFDMTRRYHDLCPLVLQPHTSAASAKELKFSDMDSGFIVATAGSKAIGRGRTIQFFHGSESAFWPNADEHLAGLGQAVPDAPGTEVILESTGNGVGNTFHQLYMAAIKGKGEYELIFVPWFWQHEYQADASGFEPTTDEMDYARRYDLKPEQLAWRRKKIDGDFRGDVALFDQEYPATAALAFRRVSGDPLIDPDLVAQARAPHGPTAQLEPTGPRLMGVDPAEYGSDASAIVMRQGRLVHPAQRYWKRGTMELVGLVALEADRWQPEQIFVDCTGVGSGVADRLTELGYPVSRVHFGGRARQNDIYVNRRAEMWGTMREWFADQPNQIPDDDALEADLTAPQYSYDSSRRLVLESKEAMAKRGISSPDSADALALTFAEPFASAAEVVTKHKQRRRTTRDWRTL